MELASGEQSDNWYGNGFSWITVAVELFLVINWRHRFYCANYYSRLNYDPKSLL